MAPAERLEAIYREDHPIGNDLREYLEAYRIWAEAVRSGDSSANKSGETAKELLTELRGAVERFMSSSSRARR